MLDSKGFDLWAQGYDKTVNLSEESDEYPFAGYKDVLNFIYNEVRKKDEASILDIGFGTGVLTVQLYRVGCIITGIDFSNNMINIARKKMPEANLIKFDFTKGLPEEVKNKNFDFIISTYAIHHLIDKEKVNFIRELSLVLNKKGKILIGDVSFETRDELEKSKQKYIEQWDKEEVYFVAEEIKKNLNKEYVCEYVKMSHCAGILTIAKS